MVPKQLLHTSSLTQLLQPYTYLSRRNNSPLALNDNANMVQLSTVLYGALLAPQAMAQETTRIAVWDSRNLVLITKLAQLLT
ncbi:hypothetical protein IAQ61_004360 [Plenodomus lingam]|uniref:uncharacterized protein n=1 Tax=Leptosphaeria maculans TaxID=5022 RepID=UPI0033175956|nr:hypothetical protein IAQ61_004360 [Plenodomus lingam]